MKVIVIGATGPIGRAVADALATEHEVVRASRQGGVKVDIEDPRSIRPRPPEISRPSGTEPRRPWALPPSMNAMAHRVSCRVTSG
jgi:nucleoside-diphosphate-sugar epimerase